MPSLTLGLRRAGPAARQRQGPGQHPELCSIYRMRVTLPGCAVRVASDSREAIDLLASLYPPTHVAIAPDLTSPHIRLCTVPTAEEGQSVYRISTSGNSSLHATTLGDAVALVESLINVAAVTLARQYLLIHAAAVASPLGAILLPAPSGAGKSTLAAALVLSGLSYLTDDIAALRLTSPEIRAFPKPIALKTGGWRALCDHDEALLPRPLEAHRQSGEFVRLLPMRHKALPPDRSIGVRHVVVPRRLATGGARFEPLPRGLAFATIASQALNRRARSRAGLEALATLVEGACCHLLYYSRLCDATAALSSIH